MSRLVLLAALALGCADNGPGPAGDPCLTSVECEEGTVCYQTAIRGRECMTLCDPATTRLCEGGAVCLAGPSVSVCYTGGERGVDPEDLRRRLPASCRSLALAPDVGHGCGTALALAQRGDRIVVLGSFLTVGPALDWLGL